MIRRSEEGQRVKSKEIESARGINNENANVKSEEIENEQ